MLALMVKLPTFCHPFFRRETTEKMVRICSPNQNTKMGWVDELQKLIDSMMLEISSSSVMPTLPTATPMQRTFLSWNLMVDLTSVILAERSSLWETGVGNFPAVENIC